MSEENDGIAATLVRAGLPTREDLKPVDRRARLAREVDRKITERFEAWQRKQTAKPTLSTAERREAAIRGLERALQALRRSGDTAKASKGEKLLAEARTHLARHIQTAAAYQEAPTAERILRDAAAPIAATLQKTIGGFEDAEEAIQFVLRSWPLQSARVTAARAADHLTKLSLRANDAQQSFWFAIEAAAALVVPKTGSASVGQLVYMGSL